MSSSAIQTSSSVPVVLLKDVTHRYGKVVALDNVCLDIPSGCMVGIIGPDGVGKSTLMALIAGSKKIQQGRVDVLGGDIAQARHRDAVCPQIAYMPQGLGKNLYLELSVYENVDFMARLFGLSASERRARVKKLLDASGLGRFPDRPAGKLSGGMKQKVGLCGALVHEPDLLILDEPTTGVDPLSRRQFWTLIDDIRSGRPGMSVVISTAYMEEAQRWDWIIAMDAGRVLATGTPAELMRQTNTQDLESCFVALLPEEKRIGHTELVIPPRTAATKEIAIEAEGLTRSFGKFTAVDHVNLSIERGEIFGFLGSNGCGKSTTMKMLTGLLPPTEGTATIFGQSVEAESMEGRKHIGYMTQAFSLYTELTVRQNLVLDARLYHIPPEKAEARIKELVEKFGLGPHLDTLAEDLPLGIRQRLSLAVAVLHEPEMLILDEPTSGVDPVARDNFWELLIDLSRRQGVTIFVTTHFMNEGMRCDRISLMNAGKVLACDAPQKLIEARKASSLEEAFIGYMEDAIAAESAAKPTPATPSTSPAAKPAASSAPAAPPAAPPNPQARWFSLGRMLAYTNNEAMQIRRDPVRLAFAFIGSALLMLAFGFGISFDVEHIRYAAYDFDRSPESRYYLAQFSGAPRYFAETAPIRSTEQALERLQSDDISLMMEIPPNFGRDLRKGSNPDILANVDGADAFRAETIAQYVQGVNNTITNDPGSGIYAGPQKNTPNFQLRYIYNPTFESIYAIVPSVPALVLILIPAILMAVSIVREKELGSIINFYVTPTRRLEYLLGKQLPYVVISMLNYFILVGLATTVFGVSIKGSFLMLTFCTLIYVIVTTGIGMAISSFTGSQVAAVFVTAVLTVVPTAQFSGLFQPVSTLEGLARTIGMIWPTTYYMHSSLGAFTKGLGPALMLNDVMYLVCCIPILWAASVLGMRKQEK
jgi:ribosome-dependent ATPase